MSIHTQKDWAAPDQKIGLFFAGKLTQLTYSMPSDEDRENAFQLLERFFDGELRPDEIQDAYYHALFKTPIRS
jgi:hypothetical protein